MPKLQKILHPEKFNLILYYAITSFAVIALLSLVVGWIFSRMGYNVTGCGSGAEALEKMQERDFDVVILDMNMPVMNGIEAMKRVKEIEPTTEVIVLTAKERK